MTYNELIENLTNKITNYFVEVYHSAETINTDKGKFPAVVNSDEWITLEPTDKIETIYIRKNGDDQAEVLKMGGCINDYKITTPLRIVYFRDHIKNHNEILAKLMQAVLIQGIRLRSISTDKWKLQKEESSGDYNFGATTAYFALDVWATWDLFPDTCENDFCVSLPNPFKSCAVTIPGS